VGDLAQVDLLRELAADRALDVLVVTEQAAGQGPAARVGRHGALPGEHLERPAADLQHRGEHLVLGRARHERIVGCAVRNKCPRS
jgi:hypothetical protein